MKAINVEWHEPGEKPPSSTIHGWLTKWRGTFSGDERVRSRGMREMREAAALRNYYRNKAKTKGSVGRTTHSKGRSIGGSGIRPAFSFFRSKPKKNGSDGGKSGHIAGGARTGTTKHSARRSGGGTYGNVTYTATYVRPKATSKPHHTPRRSQTGGVGGGPLSRRDLGGERRRATR